MRKRTCLGKERRYDRYDDYGRRIARCTHGNLEAIQGGGCSVEKAGRWANALDVDVGHMDVEELTQAIPPAYSQLIVGQMAMHAAHKRFGAPMFTYDEVKDDPIKRKQLMEWVRGAGDATGYGDVGLVRARVTRAMMSGMRWGTCR